MRLLLVAAQCAMLFSVAFGSHLFYEMLDIERSASQRDIKRAFRKKALKLHPDKAVDKVEAQRLFVELVEAFEILEDPNTRRQYDQNPSAFHPAPAPSGSDQQRSDTHANSEQDRERYEHAQAKYNEFFQHLQRSFDEYVQRQEARNWESSGNEDEDSFSFNFDDLWEGVDENEVNEFNSLYRQHLETHYTAHEKAVREVCLHSSVFAVLHPIKHTSPLLCATTLFVVLIAVKAVRQAKQREKVIASLFLMHAWFCVKALTLLVAFVKRQGELPSAPEPAAPQIHAPQPSHAEIAKRAHEEALKAHNAAVQAQNSVAASQQHSISAQPNSVSRSHTVTEECDDKGCTKIERIKECDESGCTETVNRVTAEHEL